MKKFIYLSLISYLAYQNLWCCSRILLIDSSPRGIASVSRMLGRYYTTKLRTALYGNVAFIHRDLEQNNFPIINSRNVAGIYGNRHFSPEASRLHDISDELIAELSSASHVIIGAPMHNFTIPANLKLYFDLIIRPNKTFRYTDGKVIGLLQDRPVTVLMPSGSAVLGSSDDLLSPLVTKCFNLLGINKVNFIEVQEFGVRSKQDSMLHAQTAIDQEIDSLY